MRACSAAIGVLAAAPADDLGQESVAGLLWALPWRELGGDVTEGMLSVLFVLEASGAMGAPGRSAQSKALDRRRCLHTLVWQSLHELQRRELVASFLAYAVAPPVLLSRLSHLLPPLPPPQPPLRTALATPLPLLPWGVWSPGYSGAVYGGDSTCALQASSASSLASSSRRSSMSAVVSVSGAGSSSGETSPAHAPLPPPCRPPPPPLNLDAQEYTPMPPRAAAAVPVHTASQAHAVEATRARLWPPRLQPMGPLLPWPRRN